MKIIVFDPHLAAFGHHVGFNTHVIRLLSIVFDEVVFLDVDNLMEPIAKQFKVNCLPLTDKFFGGKLSEPITTEQYKSFQRDKVAMHQFWASVDTIKPDMVFLTSEGNYRTALYGSIPEKKSFKIFALVHVIWSMLKTLKSSQDLLNIIRKQVDGFFVLEPFLVDSFTQYDIKCFWFPHRSYDFSERKTVLTKQKNISFRVGTVGVINDRRNHKFLINAVSGVDCYPIEYIVAGELMPSVERDVLDAVEKFGDTTKKIIKPHFGYLKDTEFKQIVSSLDWGLLAYDELRNLQASGAVYSYAEEGVPLLIPSSTLFENYERLYPGLFLSYPSKNPQGLLNILQKARECTSSQSWYDNYLLARDNFFEKNDLATHQRYLAELFMHLLNNSQSRSSLFSLGNKAVRSKNYDEANGYYLASISSFSSFCPAYENLAYSLKRAGDLVGASDVRHQAIAMHGSIRSCGEFFLKSGKPIEILVYPVFKTKVELDGFFARFYWHFYPIVDFISKIYVFSELDSSVGIDPPPFIDASVGKFLPYFKNKLEIHKPDDFIKFNWSQITLSLVWDYSTPTERSHPFPKECSALYKKPIWRVDEENERFATSFYLKAVSSQIDVEQSRSQAKKLFKHLKNKFTNETVAVFGTGPSLSDAMNVSFEGVDTIASNSMVKNIKLLDHIQPKLIVCADPIFHAGVSTYAEEFRQQLRFALKRYLCPLIVPERDLHIYMKYFEGEGLEIIPIPFESKEEPNYQMDQNFYVTTTGNVLTLFLLQIGFSFAQHVDIYGCDGRPAQENNYFWGHDKSAQFNDKMDDIKFAHPGFFNISYADYYNEHCSTLEVWLSHAEKLGKKVCSRTFSYIDALNSRECKS